MNTLANIVEEVKHLSLEEMEELRHLTERYIVEKRRQEFASDHEESLKEYKGGKLTFSSDINELRKSLDL